MLHCLVNTSTVPNFLDFTINAVLRPTRYPETLLQTVEHCNLSIHTDFWSKFSLLYWMASKLSRSLDTASKFTLFSVSGLKDEKLIKRQTYMKTETCKLYSFEYYCQISLKLILIILSYTILKLVHFFETQCIMCWVGRCSPTFSVCFALLLIRTIYIHRDRKKTAPLNKML